MKRVIDDTHLTNIGNALRETLGEDSQFYDEDMDDAVRCAVEESYNRGSSDGYGAGFEEGEEFGYQSGYSSGYDEGLIEGAEEGKLAERNAFWETLQQGGTRINWQYAFYNTFWNDKIYNPIYPIKIGSLNTNMFYDTPITNTKVSLDIRGTTLNYTFRDADIVTIPELIVDENTNFNQGFMSASKLTNLTITGTLGKSVTINACPLSVASMKSIIAALKDYSTDAPFTYTLTLKDSCKTELESDTETVEFNGQNYTYFELITAKGWNLA